MQASSLLRMFMLLMAVTAGYSSSAQAEASDKFWPIVKEAFFAKRPVEEAPFIKISGPRRAESGAQVPITLSIDKSQGDAAAIKKVYVLVDANPIQLAATYHLTELLGSFQLSTRIRLETDSFVRAIGETEDGKLYMAVTQIRASGGCGGTINVDDAALRATAGKIKMNVTAPAEFNQPMSATFIIKHPMLTGLQRDLASGGYKPAYFVQKASFTYNSQPLMEVDFGVGTSEDPYLRFEFIPKAPGVLEVNAKDNEGGAFNHHINVS